MYVKNLHFINFRNYKDLQLNLCSNVNIFTGDNAQGKTNILEGIYYCSLAKSHRTSKDKEIIRWDTESAYIDINVSRSRIDKRIEIKIFKEGKKGIRVNSIRVNKIAELIGSFNVVMFSPEDLMIVKGSPSVRRKLLDIEISQLNNSYYYNLVQYNKTLNEKNMVLRKGREEELQMLDIYDSQLSKFGAYIIKERIKYIDKLNKIGSKIHSDITNGFEDLEIKYETSIKNIDTAEEELNNLFLKSRKSDIEKRSTQNGPHRDDFFMNINNINVKNYGSQGQQRTTVLSIKFSTLEIIKEQTGEYPVLLLDDVLSELDLKRQKYILSSINGIQTIITCTGIEDIIKNIKGNVKIFNVQNGEIKIN